MFTNIRESRSEKILNVKLLSIDPGKETDPIELNDKRIYFFLDGRGAASVRWLKAVWRHPIKADTALWIPGLRHQIRNCGDATVRCLVVACRRMSMVDTYSPKYGMQEHCHPHHTSEALRCSSSYRGHSDLDRNSTTVVPPPPMEALQQIHMRPRISAKRQSIYVTSWRRNHNSR